MSLRSLLSLSRLVQLGAFLLVVLSAHAYLYQPFSIEGDGLEYIVQTQAMALDGRITIDRPTRADYWNRSNPYGVELASVPNWSLSSGANTEAEQAGGGFGGLYPDRRGEFRYYHFWGYSAAVSPVYFALHRLFPGTNVEYLSFYLVNSFFFLIPFAFATFLSTCFWIPFISLLLIASPLPGYIEWEHPELYLFGLTASAFLLCFLTDRRWLPVGLLGIAAAQCPPIGLFVLSMLLWWIAEPVSESRVRYSQFCLTSHVLQLVPVILLAILLSGSSALYYWYFFGTPNLIQAVGKASIEHASFARVKDLLFSPLNGFIWSYPALCLFGALCIFTPSWKKIACIALPWVAAAWLATSTTNFSSMQLGAIRYTVWLAAPLTAVVLSTDWKEQKRAMLAIVCMLSTLAIMKLHLWKIPIGFSSELKIPSRLFPHLARIYDISKYCDNPETLAENIRGSEFARARDFNGIYIWNLSSTSSLWVISKRAFIQSHRFVWNIPVLPPFTACSIAPILRERKRGGVTFYRKADIQWQHSTLGQYVIVYMKGDVRREDVETDTALYVRS